MRFLLDTHIALWAVSDPKRLSAKVQGWISNPENDIAVSMIALWEIAIKRSVSRNRLDAPFLAPVDAKRAFVAADFELLDLSIEHVSAYETLPFHHRDPFDRLLVATASADRLTLLTRDKSLAAYGDFVMVV